MQGYREHTWAAKNRGWGGGGGWAYIYRNEPTHLNLGVSKNLHIWGR